MKKLVIKNIKVRTVYDYVCNTCGESGKPGQYHPECRDYCKLMFFDLRTEHKRTINRGYCKNEYKVSKQRIKSHKLNFR